MPRTPSEPSFGRETLRFLKDLAAHNDREWFAANRHRYDAHFVEPSLAFIERVAPAIQKISRHFTATAKVTGGSLMRIYRDTRFGRDKTPYKTNIGIQFRHERGRDVHAPGFYVHVEPGGCFLGAGIWHPEPGALAAIRREIVEQPALWARARNDRAFKRHFDLGGEQAAKVPRGLPADSPHADDLRRKDFIAGCDLTDDDVVDPSFAASVAARFAAAAPLMAFLCGALDLDF